MTINLKVTPTFLCDLLGGRMSYEACEAIVNYINDCGSESDSFYLGDIAISFAEMPADEIASDDESIIAVLENGYVVVAL